MVARRTRQKKHKTFAEQQDEQELVAKRAKQSQIQVVEICLESLLSRSPRWSGPLVREVI